MGPLEKMFGLYFGRGSNGYTPNSTAAENWVPTWGQEFSGSPADNLPKPTIRTAKKKKPGLFGA